MLDKYIYLTLPNKILTDDDSPDIIHILYAVWVGGVMPSLDPR